LILMQDQLPSTTQQAPTTSPSLFPQ